MTLSNKINDNNNGCMDECIFVHDLKASLKELIEIGNGIDLDDIIRIFGAELT